MNDLSTTFPSPSIPLFPVLSGFPAFRNTHSGQSPPSLLDTRSTLHISSGRAGIALALECAGVLASEEVLIPAYHTDSMIAPVRRIGATPIFYKIESDTQIDISDIEQKINSHTKVILVTHYFGFVQDLLPLKEICSAHGIILIEDCAHTFFGSRNGATVGQIGDYAIASSMKFFPIYDGGLLASQSHTLDDIRLQAPPSGFQVKAALNILEKSISYQRLGLAGKLLNRILLVKSIIWQAIKLISLNKRQARNAGPASADGGYGLDEHWINKSISRPSRKIIESTDLNLLVHRRRENYQKIHDAIVEISGCHPLHQILPDGAVPMVCPIYVDDPQKHFAKLKLLGVPIWRFGEYLDQQVNEKLCKNSVELSAHIFQFPCHQELTEAELDWMIQTIRTQFEQ
ncbi:MAG: aminotransferase class I/II-fold pyridoxal phosphate-dependent enzyme [Pseudomonadales bacterium]|nr:aminotransferase class I/II-fold pyridoxal phosphate-dependent enzyme [Pseudomonadales bacterium]